MRVAQNFFLLTLMVSSNGLGASSQFLISPTKNAGPVTSQSSELQLIDQLGKSNVVAGDIGIGEGHTCRGATLFPEISQQKAQVVWKNPTLREQPVSVTIAGEKSLWRTPEGASLGSTLKEFEKLNGKPFKLLGFNWDYGGTVTSWEAGKLKGYTSDKLSGHRLIVRMGLSTSGAQLGDDEKKQVVGDREFLSSHPNMQKLNPVVRQLVYQFDQNNSCQSEFKGLIRPQLDNQIHARIQRKSRISE